MEATTLIRTKLNRPRVVSDLVERPRLVGKLNKGLERKLTLVAAPAGFGKTTLISDWLQQIDRLATWLSIDESDNDLSRFMTYVITALQKIDEQIGQAGLDMLQLPQPPSAEFLMTALVNDVAAAATEFVFVLDDYHIIDAPLIHSALNFLLSHLPPHMHLVITSRADPPLSLSRLRAQAQLNEVREADLRFEPDEAHLFLNQMMGLALSSDDVIALENRTEGWVAGLQLAGLSLQGLSAENKHNFVTTFAGDDRYIVDYLLEEVLHRQPHEIQSFLLQTSILDSLCGDLCDTILGGGAEERGSAGERINSSPSGQEILETLERANLFIVPLDNRRQWYRYHQLFAELLRFHLHKTYPDRVDKLHLLASEWYQANGLETEAVRHALAAGDFERAADLIEQIAQVILSQGKLFTLQGWLQTLPDEIIQSRLRLAVYQVWTLFSTAQIEAAETRLREIENAVSREPDPHFGGEIDALRAFLAYNRGDFPGSIKYAQRASSLLPQGDSFFHQFGASLLGNAYRLNDDISSAVNVCTELSQHEREGLRVASAIMGLGNLVRLQMIQGNLHQAAQTYRQAFAGRQLQADRATPLHGVAFIGIGEVLCEWNDLEAAANHLRSGVTLCQQWPSLVEFLVDGAIGLVRVLQAQQDIDEAFSLIQEVEQFTNQSVIFRWRLPRLAACRARLWLSPNSFNLAAALRWAESSGLSPTDDPRYVYEFEYLTLARVLIAAGKRDDVLILIANLEQTATDAGRMGSVLECLILRALAQQAHGRSTDEALMTMKQALSLAEAEGYIRIFVDEGEPMAALLGRIKVERGRVKNYASKLLAILNQADTIHAFGSTQDRLSSPQSLGDQPPVDQPLVDPLSERELEVLRLLNTHLSGPEIAAELIVSINTVKTHIKRIYSKLDAGNRKEAVERAKELNLL